MPAQSRRAPRILSLGFPLPGVRVDNYNFCTAPAFFDYDALVVETRATSRFLEALLAGEQEVQTFGGSPVLAHPLHAGDIALADLLERRRDETAALLEHAGLVVVFAHAPLTHVIAEGMTWRDDAWLAPHAPSLTPADGTLVEVADYQHPLAAFIHGQAANISYRASLDAGSLPSDARVVARSTGGAILAVDYPASAGRIVVLPALKTVPSGDARYAMSDALQAGVRRLLGAPAEGRAPGWIARYPVPALDERAAALAAANERAEETARARVEAEAAHETLVRYQRLLWAEGRAGFEDAVLAALRNLAIDVYDRDPENLELRIDGSAVLLEIEASEGEVDLTPHHRLRQRLERAIEKNAAPRGLIIINGHRHTPPSERTAQATAALSSAAAQMQYAVLPATLLFEAIVAHLQDDEAAAPALRHRLVTETGLLA